MASTFGRLKRYIATLPDGRRIIVWSQSRWRARAKVFRTRDVRPVSLEETTTRGIGIGGVLTDGVDVDS